MVISPTINIRPRVIFLRSGIGYGDGDSYGSGAGDGDGDGRLYKDSNAGSGCSCELYSDPDEPCITELILAQWHHFLICGLGAALASRATIPPQVPPGHLPERKKHQ